MALRSLSDRLAERRAQSETVEPAVDAVEEIDVVVTGDQPSVDTDVMADDDSQELTADDLVLMVQKLDGSHVDVVKALFADMDDEEVRRALSVYFVRKDDFVTSEEKSNLVAAVKELLRHDPRYVKINQPDLSDDQTEFLEHKSLTAAAHRYLSTGSLNTLVYKLASDKPQADPVTPEEAEVPVAVMPEEPRVFDHELEDSELATDDSVSTEVLPDEVDQDLISAGDIAKQLGISWPDVLNLADLHQGDPSTMVSRAEVTMAFEASRRPVAVEPEVQAPASVVPSEVDGSDEITPDDSGPLGTDDDEVVAVEHVEPIDISEEFLADFIATADACHEILSTI